MSVHTPGSTHPISSKKLGVYAEQEESDVADVDTEEEEAEEFERRRPHIFFVLFVLFVLFFLHLKVLIGESGNMRESIETSCLPGVRPFIY